MVTQILVIRQVMVVFQGNELVIGLAMGLWMLLTGLGSRMAGSFKSTASLHFLMALFSFLAIALITWGRYRLVTPGIMAGLDTTTLVMIISLMPFCVVSGMMFPILSEAFHFPKDKGSLHHAYALESAGSLAGGLVFSLLMVYILSTWQSLAAVMVLNLVATAVILHQQKKRIVSFLLFGAVLSLLAISVLLDPLNQVEELAYPGQEIILQKDTPYGRLVVTELDGQVNIYSNGTPMTQQNDVASREEHVHYTMLAKPGARRVLMISGGTGGALDEVLKYPEAHVDYLEVDPFLMEAVKDYAGIPSGNRVKVINQDPVRYIMETRVKYDIILQNAPDPSSGLLNRMYTADYIHRLKGCLQPGGILQISLSGGANYLGDEALILHSTLYYALKKEFKLVGLVPGGSSYFMAGDDLPNKMLGQLYAESGITNQYVNPDYINEMQLGQRSRKIMDQLDEGVSANTDVRPVGYYLVIREWLNRFQVPYWILPAILGTIVVVFLFFLGPLNLGLFAGGFSAASAEFMLLLWLQVTYGYVYQLAGLIFTMFMAGLVLGSWLIPNVMKQFTYRIFLLLQLVMSAFLMLMTAYVFLSEVLSIAGWANLVLIFGFTLSAGTITGLQYTTAIRIRREKALKNASLSYSADLAGSALGIMMVSIFLVPLLGMFDSGMGLAGFGLVVLTILFFRKG